MSRFFTHSDLVPYTPGEQPRGSSIIKLNTNEAPYAPPDSVVKAMSEAAAKTHLYSDPSGASLREALAEYHGVVPENVTLGNGSDETLAFAFSAFGDALHPFAFPDITYGLYPIAAKLYGVPYTEIPLRGDLTVCVDDYIGIGKNIVLANPNAPTCIALPISEIERIVQSNPDNVVIIDEAYADFWGQTAIPLTSKYDNLLVVRTYSKSRFMAGARIGYAIGSKELISDLETIRNSFNPYNLGSPALAGGAAALAENEYYESHWREIIATREDVSLHLKSFGFEVTESKTNFLFARSDKIAGAQLYKELRERGFLVRSLSHPRIADWLRITIGSPEQMEMFCAAALEIMMEA